MTREERHALLGPKVIADIHACVDAAPEPSPELVDELRRIMTRPGQQMPAARPAPRAA